jgi:hypothetical protein
MLLGLISVALLLVMLLGLCVLYIYTVNMTSARNRELEDIQRAKAAVKQRRMQLDAATSREPAADDRAMPWKHAKTGTNEAQRAQQVIRSPNADLTRRPRASLENDDDALAYQPLLSSPSATSSDFEREEQRMR